MIGGMLSRRRWGVIPLRVAAASCMSAALICGSSQPTAAQALNIASSRPQWGADAAIDADLLGESPKARERDGNHKKPLRVLLVGNSYTKFNLLHMLIERVAEAAPGPRLKVDVEARGGYSLRMHLKSRSAMIKIRNGHYSHVVLQGHSLSAIDHPDELAEDAERFHNVITASGSRTVLYETWARKPNTSLYRKHALVRTFDDMAGRIDTAYTGIARRLHAELAPVGGAFVRAWKSTPVVSVWGNDGSHPTLAGSYLAACVLYGAITGRDPRESTWAPFPIDARQGAQIRAVAAASLSAVPEWPATDVLAEPPRSAGDREPPGTVARASVPLTTSVAAKGGSAADLDKAARSSAASAKSNRTGKREHAGGHVAASIADLLGRAPGQSEAPILGPGQAGAAPRAAGSRDDSASEPAAKPAVFDVPLGTGHAAESPALIF
jgi:hypothetical protein